MKLLNARVTHKRASIPILNAVTLRDEGKALRDLVSIEGVKEAALLQTCNRVEIWAVLEEADWEASSERVLAYWRKKANLDDETFRRVVEVEYDRDAIRHLFRVASGIESMLIGEEQVLGQVRRAYQRAVQHGTAGRYLAAVFGKAIRVGGRARSVTGISRGAISIGSATVQLLEQQLGGLGGKSLIIVGAGETGELVGKALAARRKAAIFVANRTYERGVRLAGLLGGRAVRFDKIRDLLTKVDAAIVATAAPHYVITEDMVRAAMASREKPLLIVDLSQPVNVDPEVARVPNVKLLNLDDLREIAELNLKARKEEVEKVERFVEQQLDEFEPVLRRLEVEPLVASICRAADALRRREVEELRRLLSLSGERWEIVERFSQELVESILRAPLNAIRRAALEGDLPTIEAARQLFGVQEGCSRR